jgi:hypothetical protein
VGFDWERGSLRWANVRKRKKPQRLNIKKLQRLLLIKKKKKVRLKPSLVTAAESLKSHAHLHPPLNHVSTHQTTNDRRPDGTEGLRVMCPGGCQRVEEQAEEQVKQPQFQVQAAAVAQVQAAAVAQVQAAAVAQVQAATVAQVQAATAAVAQVQAATAAVAQVQAAAAAVLKGDRVWYNGQEGTVSLIYTDGTCRIRLDDGTTYKHVSFCRRCV